MYNEDIISMLDRKAACSNNDTRQPVRKVQREASLQIQCVTWFRMQYPAFAKLLFHAKNESSMRSRRIAIDAAGGVVPGVPDLILALPAFYPEKAFLSCNEMSMGFSGDDIFFCNLGIELKYGNTNNQTPAQKEFQKFYEASENRYELVRSLDQFIAVVKDYMKHVPESVKINVGKVFVSDPVTDHNKRTLRRIAKG